MIVRYNELRPALLNNFANEISFIDYFLSPRENNEIHALIVKFGDLNQITNAMQKDDLDLVDARSLLDGVKDRYPELDPNDKYLSAIAKIIK